MDFIERLENEIAHQTRNGREDVYIEVDDLNKLGYGIDPNKKGRVFVDVAYLRIAINRYKFKDSLKVETKPITFSQLQEEIDKIEKER